MRLFQLTEKKSATFEKSKKSETARNKRTKKVFKKLFMEYLAKW